MGGGSCRVPPQVRQLCFAERPQGSLATGTAPGEPAGAEAVPAECFPGEQERMEVHSGASEGERGGELGIGWRTGSVEDGGVSLE